MNIDYTMSFSPEEIECYNKKVLQHVKIEENGCHSWIGSTVQDGIPNMSMSGPRGKKNIRIRYFLWVQDHEKFKTGIFSVKPVCGNDKCVNKNHLDLVHKKEVLTLQQERDKFMEKTISGPNGCILWDMSKIRGYGVYKFRGKTPGAHRVSYILHKNNGNPLPSKNNDGEKLMVLHTCKHKDCVNPEHLKFDTIILQNPSNKTVYNRVYRKRKREYVFTEEDLDDARNKLRNNIIESSIDKKDDSINGPCHLWKGDKNNDGYGRITFMGKHIRTHVLACEIKHGIRDNLEDQVRHLCGVRSCCNPEHVVYGTPYENSMDKFRHGTNYILNEEKIIEIKKSSESSQVLAEKYGVSKDHMAKVRRGVAHWTHIE